MCRSDLAADLYAVAVWKVDVEDGDVWVRRRYPSVRLLGGARFPDDLDVRLGLEELADAATHHLVVVEEEHSERHLPILTRPGSGARHRF